MKPLPGNAVAISK